MAYICFTEISLSFHSFINYVVNTYCSFEGEGEVSQSCLTLCDPVDYSLPGFSVHGILQARVLEWGAIAFSRGSSRPRDQTWVSRIGARCFI